MLTAFVVAEDLIGLELGAELGMDNVTGANGGDAAFTFTPWVQYMNSFDALDIYARAKWWFTFDDPMYQSPEFEIEGAYNIDAGPGILSIVLWNETAMKICDGESTYGGYLEPSVKYALSGDFGTVFFQPGFGIFYDKDVDAQYDIAFKVGYSNPIGFGIDFKAFYNVSGGAEEMREYRLLPYYENGPLYFEVDIRTDGEFDVINMWPYVSYAVTDRITVWTWVGFEGIGGDGDVVVTPIIGASYKF